MKHSNTPPLPLDRAGQPVLPVAAVRGLHIVACFEAAKGLLVLLAGVGALSLLNRNVSQIAENAVKHLQLNPASHYPHIFVQLAGQITNSQLWFIAGGAVLYSTLRLVEAYGLWKNRVWAEWLAVAGGTVYLPFEVHSLIKHVTYIKIGLIALNIAVVLYVARILWIKRHARAADRARRDSL